MSEWANRIRRAIDASGLSLYAIAREAGIGYARLHEFHTRGTGLYLDNAERIARVVGLDLRPAGRQGKVTRG